MHVSSRAHFGLNDITHIDSLEVIWTGGTKKQTLYDLEINQLHEIIEDTSTVIINDVKNTKNSYSFSIMPNPVTDQLTVQFNLPLITKGKLEICNTLGEIVKSNSIDVHANHVNINMNTLN